MVDVINTMQNTYCCCVVEVVGRVVARRVVVRVRVGLGLGFRVESD